MPLSYSTAPGTLLTTFPGRTFHYTTKLYYRRATIFHPTIFIEASVYHAPILQADLRSGFLSRQIGSFWYTAMEKLSHTSSSLENINLLFLQDGLDALSLVGTESNGGFLRTQHFFHLSLLIIFFHSNLKYQTDHRYFDYGNYFTVHILQNYISHLHPFSPVWWHCPDVVVDQVSAATLFSCLSHCRRELGAEYGNCEALFSSFRKRKCGLRLQIITETEFVIQEFGVWGAGAQRS